MTEARRLVTYSQHLEDIRLIRTLRTVEKGFYIDVGANDPEYDSVTKLFYDRGWSGINLEPVKYWFNALCEQRPLDINLEIAAGAKAGEILLYEVVASGLSTSSRIFAERHKTAGMEVREITVPVQTLDEICAKYVRGPIHFLKIDVEGSEASVLAGCNLSRWRPWIIMIEATEPNTTVPSFASWEPSLVGAGYKFAGADLVNRFYVASERDGLSADLFRPIDDYERAEVIALRRDRDAQRQEHNAQRQERDAQRQERDVLRQEHDTLRQEHDALRQEHDALRPERDALCHELERARNDDRKFREDVYNSTSWRVTTPLRALSRFISFRTRAKHVGWAKRAYSKIGLDSAADGTALHGLHRALRLCFRTVTLAPPEPKSEPKPEPEPEPQPEPESKPEPTPEPVPLFRPPQPNTVIDLWENYRDPIRRIAVVKGDHIGDFIIALPVFDQLRVAFPEAHITLICSPWNRELGEATRLFDNIEVQTLDSEAQRNGHIATAHRIAAIEAVKTLGHFDLVIDLKPEAVTHFLLPHFSADVVAGFDLPRPTGASTFSFPRRETLEQALDRPLHNRELLSLFVGALVARYQCTRTSVADAFLRRMAKGRAPERSGKPVVGLNLGAGSETRCWAIENFAALCRAIPSRFVLFGAPSQAKEAEALIRLTGPEVEVENRIGRTTIVDFIAEVAGLDVFVGHDTGTTHIAAVLTPTVCLFSGVTMRERWAPIGPKVVTLEAKTDCSPCGHLTLAACPRDHACMRAIAVGDVVGAVKALMRDASPPESPSAVVDGRKAQAA